MLNMRSGGRTSSGSGTNLLPSSPSSFNSSAAIKITKENSGASAKKRRQQRIAAYLIGILVVYVFVTTVYQSHFSGMFVPDVDIDPQTGKSRIRRRPDRNKKLLNPDEKTSEIDGILEGYFTLIDINVPFNGLQSGVDQQHYHGITATFCAIDWDLQLHGNPSTVPMFKDLKAQSRLCDATSITVDLYDIVQQAKDFDARIGGSGGGMSSSKHVVIKEPHGVVFHQTRCGSTLAANIMASLSSNTKPSRVYSESPPPVNALRACERNPCNPQFHVDLVRDVFYMMGRSTTASKQHPLNYLFFKIQSIGVMNIDIFTEAFPNVPWIFVYRDSIEIMQSHLKDISGSDAEDNNGWLGVAGGGGGKKKNALASHTPVCARNYRSRNQPPVTELLLQQHNIASPEELSITQYCAAHLGALSLSAIQEHQRTGKGRFVNYKDLPDIMWDSVMPDDFKIPIDSDDITRMQKTSGVYSKGRGSKANIQWKDDSTKKQSTASQVVIDATHMFMDDIFNEMEALSRGGEGRR